MTIITNPTTAEQYADSIVEELDALETLTRCRSYGPMFVDAMRVLEWENIEDVECLGGPVEVWLQSVALDFAFLADTRDNSRTRVEILRTVGGPHAVVTRDSDDGTAVVVTVHSGSDSCTRRVHLDVVSNLLDEMAADHAMTW